MLINIILGVEVPNFELSALSELVLSELVVARSMLLSGVPVCRTLVEVPNFELSALSELVVVEYMLLSGIPVCRPLVEVISKITSATDAATDKTIADINKYFFMH
jgi:hypothetical protein